MEEGAHHMTSPPAWEYIGVLACCIGLTVFLTPLALRVARRRNLLDTPGPGKSHAEAVPYLGGVAIVVAFSLVILVAGLLRSNGADTTALMVTLSLGVGLALLGLVDDLRGLPVWVRIALEIGAGIVVYATGTRAHLAGAGLGLDAVVTVAWVVGITNAFNLLDNMDGLSAGVAAIASFWFFVVGVVNGQYFVAILSLALVGCAAGFLRHNRFPARIYMGDAGSLYLGFVLSVLALRLRSYESLRVTFLVPIVVLAVPIFDTALVVIARLIQRRSPFQGGRDHSSHRLVFLGLPVPAAVALIYAVSMASGWLGVIMAQVSRGTSFLLGGWVAAVGVFLGIMLGIVPVYETSRRRHYMLQEVKSHEPEPIPHAEPGPRLPGFDDESPEDRSA
ncbi:MAG TPA: MraY family glycosyltransferase [Acidimicrobiales bacterium]|nr:MraY family glycosyltransferase [Acidimicrobiales bacterium]